jgi:hypothetical protein
MFLTAFMYLNELRVEVCSIKKGYNPGSYSVFHNGDIFQLRICGPCLSG